jgi:hypothetical protein
MKYIAGAIVSVALIILMLYLIPVRETVIYDCSIAEWHPDIPIEVREECRKIRKRSNGVTV